MTAGAISVALVLSTSVLLAQEPVATVLTEAEYSKAMKELQSLDTALRNNIEEVARADLERMLLYDATMNARRDAARVEEILADVVTFWETRKTKEAAALSREALMEAGAISKALAVIDLQSPSTATLAQDRLDKVCARCHSAYRERSPTAPTGSSRFHFLTAERSYASFLRADSSTASYQASTFCRPITNGLGSPGFRASSCF